MGRRCLPRVGLLPTTHEPFRNHSVGVPHLFPGCLSLTQQILLTTSKPAYFPNSFLHRVRPPSIPSTTANRNHTFCRCIFHSPLLVIQPPTTRSLLVYSLLALQLKHFYLFDLQVHGTFLGDRAMELGKRIGGGGVGGDEVEGGWTENERYVRVTPES